MFGGSRWCFKYSDIEIESLKVIFGDRINRNEFCVFGSMATTVWIFPLRLIFSSFVKQSRIAL